MATENKADKAKDTKKLYTIAGVFKELAQKGAQDRKTLGQAIFKYISSKGQTKNVRGRVLTEDKCISQVSAVIRDINDARQGWWSTFKVEVSDTHIKIVPAK
jgi:hypothetical protein